MNFAENFWPPPMGKFLRGPGPPEELTHRRTDWSEVTTILTQGGNFTPTLQKPEGFRVKASEGEVVVLYFKPSATQNLKPSGFPDVLGRSWKRSPKGKQHGKIGPILRIHQWRYPRISHFTMILEIIAYHYLIFAMLFMQLRGKQWITDCSAAQAGINPIAVRLSWNEKCRHDPLNV